jgi:hypothetical protein
MVGVLQVAARRAGADQGRHQLGGLHPVARLGIDGDRHVNVAADPRRRGQHLVRRRLFVVVVAERRRDASAGGGDDREARHDDRPGGGHVPGVRQHQRAAGPVQRLQQLTAVRQAALHDHVALAFPVDGGSPRAAR